MTRLTETLIKQSDNVISLTLTEDGTPTAINWTGIDIHIGRPNVLTISRTSQVDGITYSTGVLTITPGDLTEDLSVLQDGRLYPVVVEITGVGVANGAFFGDSDSDAQLWFLISDPVAP